MSVNLRVVANIIGLLLVFNGLFMLVCLPASFYYNPSDLIPISFSGSLTIGLGLLLWVFSRSQGKPSVRKREGFLIVTSGWLAMVLSGTLPYIMSGSVVNLTDAFFESMSGYTTTGATIIADLDVIPRDIILWRSITQWLGGMGFIVLAVAILPVLGIGGMQLFMAESSGIRYDKVQPRIRETAKRLWLIYVGMTAVCTILLQLSGMTWFDAVNHGMTTVASAGFSTQNDSLAGYGALTQYVVIVFMFLTAINYTLLYFALNGRPLRLLESEELRHYALLMGIATVGVTAIVHSMGDAGIEQHFRESLFQVVSILSTTGFVTADYTAWTPFLTMFFFLLFFIGGCAGSTAGGVKAVRHIILAKNSILELKRQLHPSAVIPVRLNKRAVNPTVTYSIKAFIMLYLIIFALGCVVMAMLGVDFETALGAVATSLGNVGPGIGNVGPLDNFAQMPVAAKWFLSGLMLIGRLEIFTVIVLFTPYFWKRF